MRRRPDHRSSGTEPAAATALVLGGASDIGLAAVSRLATSGLRHVTLAVRDTDALERRLDSEPLPVDNVDVVAWDALDADSHHHLVHQARRSMGRLDVVICAVGLLGHHAGLPLDPVDADVLLRSNFSGPAAAVLAAAHELVEQGSGDLVVLSSVAGARARRSNFVYGSAKAGLDAFSQGLADALHSTDVRVHIIRPGFVRSKMTTGLTPAPFSTTPSVVAEAIASAVSSGRPQIMWVPRILGPIMAVMRVMPHAIWRRISGDR